LVAIFGALFAFLWWKGYLVRLRAYWGETMEELKKCTWPSWIELKGSTVVVCITIALLGGFTVVVDRVATLLVLWLT
jgi:preprotein translocase subunit SecE